MEIFEMNRQQISASTRAKKLLQSSLVYNCQCGKYYLTFSALYLHMKNKHEKRLRTKAPATQFTTEYKNGKKYITFYYSDLNQSGNHSITSEHKQFKQNKRFIENQKVKGLIEEYMKEIEEQTERCPYLEQKKNIIKLFIKYTDEVFSIDNSLFQKIDIVLCFNQFIIYFIPHVLSTDSTIKIRKQTIILVMYQFGRWLNLKKYSNYSLIFSQDYRYLPYTP